MQPDSKTAFAVRLLWISLIFGIIRAVLEITKIKEIIGMIIGVGIALPIIAIIALLIYMIGKGKNWAKLTYLVLFIVGLSLNIPALVISIFTNPLFTVLRLGDMIPAGIGLILLFRHYQPKTSDDF
ncbi:MAG: hypothetical protein CMO12_01865 [Thaumarchaeota archaeon]|nr:hypothetical protein [Nitrososphaerota archaeon]